METRDQLHTPAVLPAVTPSTGGCVGTATYIQRGPSGHVGGKLLYQYYDLYRRLRLQFLVLLMVGVVTPETCRVTLQ